LTRPTLLYAAQRLQYRLLGAERALQSRHDVAIAQGPCIAIRRTAYDQVHDEYLAGAERPGDDLELSLLLIERGWKVVRQPHARAATQPKTTWRAYLAQQLRWHRSWYREWPRTRRQLGRHSAPLTLAIWVRTLAPTPLRALAWRTRHATRWGSRGR
jgi:hypothetical protein